MSAVRCESAAGTWTEEQRVAIERRRGRLLVDAGAGSGKTSVLVERFARAVLEDGVPVSAILTITFTEKAAAELRERIRMRLRELGADEPARATEGSFISTIHGFCARLLRANALAAGIDPGFAVLDEQQAQRLADAAFDDALERLAGEEPAAIALIAAYGAGGLRGAILDCYGELRSRGQTEPRLPPLAPGPELEPARAALLSAAGAAARELGAVPDPSAKVTVALERLERLEAVVSQPGPWPGEVARLGLPGGNGAALSTPVCDEYTAAVDRFKTACEHLRVARDHRLLGRLLELFGSAYAQRKRAGSGLDFEDLELAARDLLAGDAELRDRWRARFQHVMVDELQDTNGIQLELIEQVSGENVFMVGDAQQSIYAFRHADVELFEQLGERLEAAGGRVRLQTNFRSRPGILALIAQVFSAHGFVPLRPGRTDGGGIGAPLVELLIADKAGEWPAEGIAAPWRVAEARALAARIAELLAGGASAREVVVLTRATTDLRAYERALEERGIPTYVIGGRGYWSHPQVLDMVAYLRALANPRDEEALLTVLASPLVGASLDALVVLADAARKLGRDPWWVLREPDGSLDELSEADRERLGTFASWFSAERAMALRLSVEELVDRALELTGYDLAMLAMPGGARRLANVRKLMRLAREHEAVVGRDLRAFLQLVRGRQAGWAGFGDERESEAPVEGEALDAVRLMTIHRAKGLEFPIVCVADLGRQPWRRAELVRIGRDGRFGMRLAEPGTGKREPALDYERLGDERLAAEQREERRLFYVAMTRARERLILSGAAKLEAWDNERSPMGWIGPALMEAGIEPAYARPEDLVCETGPATLEPSGEAPREAPPVPPRPPAAAPPAPVTHLSYSSLGEYGRCGYRFYVERVLGIPATAGAGGAGRLPGMLGAAERGVLVHTLLEKLDFRRPAVPAPLSIIEAAEAQISFEEAEELAALIARFATTAMCARLAAAGEVRREQRFSFLLEGGIAITGAIDVLARESGETLLVVDYKSDRLEDRDPGAIVDEQYAVQRLIYALAALRTGAAGVEVAHLFLERPEQPVTVRFESHEAGRLERELAALASGVMRRRFAVTDVPHRAICNGCPAEGGMCSWPLELTRRDAPDRLF